MEAERNEAYRAEKVSQERLRLVWEEHERAMEKIKVKYEQRIGDFES